MMSVKEYAEDANISIEKVLEMAKSLGYDVSKEDDMLTYDAIIDLDNITPSNVEEENTYIEEDIEEKDYDLEDELDDKAENLASASNIKYKDNSSKQKKVKKNSSKEINAKKKEMYKNKEKLTQNVAVSEFSEVLGVPATEVIKKLISLGIMASLNNSIAFSKVINIPLNRLINTKFNHYTSLLAIYKRQRMLV